MLHQRRPSPDNSWVGSCIISFVACSAFTRVTTCRLAKSPYATLYTGGLRRLCCLHRRSDCYRVERSSSRAGLSPAVDQRLSRRTANAWLHQLSVNSKRLGRVFQLLQLRVLRFGFLQDGDVGVGVFPEGKEILVC